jgi:hypothetical protein
LKCISWKGKKTETQELSEELEKKKEKISWDSMKVK